MRLLKVNSTTGKHGEVTRPEMEKEHFFNLATDLDNELYRHACMAISLVFNSV